MEEFEILDNDLDYSTNPVAVSFCNMPMFVLLSVLSFGLYPVWWVYKAWNYYKEREALDIQPVWRAIFTIIWIYPLFEKIKSDGNKIGLYSNYISGLLLIGVLVCNISSRLPGNYSLISLMAFSFFIAPVNLFNQLLDEDDQVTRINTDNLTQRRVTVIIFGILLWGLNLMVLMSEQETGLY